MRRRSFDPGAFEPEVIAAMSDALEAALDELPDSRQRAEMAAAIALRIIAVAKLGERDPARLRAAALAAARGEND
jgi:cytochrome P450